MHPTLSRRAALALGATAIAAPILAAPAVAQQGFPNRPIRLFIPWAPGGTTDVELRALCQAASQKTGQTVIPENTLQIMLTFC